MNIKKYEYYFKKPRSEIAKDILGVLIVGGVIAVVATSPFLIQNLLRKFRKLKRYPNKKIYDTFYRLKKQGCINFYEKNNQIYISLTERGRRKAGWMQINDLRISRPKRWDGKWRVLLFDIVELKRLHREALRGKLINMGFILLQKSAWIIPYDCEKEIELLKSFFGLSGREVRLLVVNNIGEDKEFRKFFKLS